MIAFRVEADVERALAQLGKVRSAMGDQRPIFAEVVEPEFYRMQADRFDTEGGGDHWQRLSVTYAAWKARHFPGRRVLEREGLLKESLTRRGGRFQVRRLSGRELVIGTRHPAALFHQQGARRMPKRQIINLTAADQRRIQGLIEAWFARRVVR